MRGCCESLRYFSTFVPEYMMIHTNRTGGAVTTGQLDAFLTIYNQPPLSGKRLPSRIPLLPITAMYHSRRPSCPPTAPHNSCLDPPPTPPPHSNPSSDTCTGSSAPPAGSQSRTTSECCSYTHSHSAAPPDSDSNSPTPGLNRRYTPCPRMWSSR